MNIIAIDLGGTRIKIGLLIDKLLTDLRIIEANSSESLENHLSIIDDTIQQFVLVHSLVAIDGIVMAFPGIVNPKFKTVISTSKKYEDATQLDLSSYYYEKWSTKFFLENDARLACIGEWKYGSALGFNDVVMCTLGTGFGSSAIINGKILHGFHHQAGILGGHTIIDFKNITQQCSCGGYGCVEAMASTWNIDQFAKNHPQFNESTLAQVEKIDWQTVDANRKEDDALSLLLYDHCLNVWAAGIANLIHAYDPQIIVLGGGIMHAGDDLKSALEKNIAKRVWCPSGLPEFRVATYPDTAALLGSTTLLEKDYE